MNSRLLTFAFLLITTLVNGQQYKLALNFDSEGLGSDPKNFIVYLDKLYFTADDGIHGRELRVYDGINPSSMVDDIMPGSASSDIDNLSLFNGKLYFTAHDETHGNECWVYDGNDMPARVAATNQGWQNLVAGPFTVINGKAYFIANDGIHGGELWVYDGINPPSMVFEIRDGPVGSSASAMMAYNNKLYFTADDGQSGTELWVYDGTNLPHMISDIMPGAGSSYPQYLTGFKGKVYFGADDGIHGRELWSYDGINTTTMVTDFANVPAGLNPHGILEYNDMLYFSIDTVVYHYDGLNTPEPIYNTQFGSPSCTIFNGILYFAGIDLKNGEAIWSFNGENPPTRVAGINSEYFHSGPDYLTVFQDKLLFSANDGIVGNELFLWDGSNPVSLVDDIRKCSSGSSPEIDDILNNEMYILTNGNSGRDLWTYDGLNLPKKMPRACTDHYCIGPSSSDFILFNSKLYFSAFYGETYGSELYSYDGINSPVLVADLASGPAYSNPESFIIFKNKLYFTAGNNFSNRKLWMYDGSNPPSLVSGIDPDPHGQGPSSLLIFNDKLFFQSNDSIHGLELWVYDGSNPPALVADLNNGKGDGVSGLRPVLLNGKMYFGANDGIHGFEPFEFDGANPPSMIYDINPGVAGSNPAYFDSLYNGKMYINANDGVHGRELWEWDGINPPGMIADMNPGSYMNVPNSSNPTFMEILKGKMYFRALQSMYNDNIWEYDGTILKSITSDIHYGCARVFGGSLIYNNRLFFMVMDIEHCNLGKQFWSYDGTNPPSMIVDIKWKEGSITSGLTLYKRKLYFTANDPCEGNELFVLCSKDSTVTAKACKRYDFNGRHLTTSGVYYDTIPNRFGLDSLITLNLAISVADTAVEVIGNSLVSSASNVQYQWIDCNNNYQLMSGQTNKSLEVNQSGSYAVIVSQDNCADTSRCVAVILTDIAEDKYAQPVSVYPNPVKDELIINLNQDIANGIIEITDMNGVLFSRNQYEINKTLKVDVSGMHSGVYIVKVITEQGVSSARMVKF
jgi:ELWxxDGT repeat protein